MTVDLSPITRANGGFAMLAIDQRESMRAMFAEHQDHPVTDKQLVDFKVATLKALTPFASACLLDREFSWDAALAEKAVASGCGLIAAADRFIADANELVADIEIDPEVVPAKVKADGAAAMKLLITWRPDQDPDGRIDMVEKFIAVCRSADLISIIEPVSRRARDGREIDLHLGILDAARELGNLGADVYKAEVPMHAKGSETEVRAQCAEMSRIIQSPWVVLSSGVDPDRFPTAVEWACKEGARGFLAGRAVWKNSIGKPDPMAALADDAKRRLERLCNVVDQII